MQIVKNVKIHQKPKFVLGGGFEVLRIFGRHSGGTGPSVFALGPWREAIFGCITLLGQSELWWKWSFFMGLSLRGVENRIRGRKMIHFGGGHVSGHLKYDFFIFWVHFDCHYQRIFVHTLSLSAYICPYAVTIGVYLSICCHYWRIFVHTLSLLGILVHMLSLLAYIWSYTVTIGVYLFICCHY